MIIGRAVGVDTAKEKGKRQAEEGKEERKEREIGRRKTEMRLVKIQLAAPARLKTPQFIFLAGLQRYAASASRRQRQPLMPRPRPAQCTYSR